MATAGDGSATVSWTASATNGSPVTTYTVTSNPGNIMATTPDGSTTSASVGTLANGTAYTFTVVANSAAGASPASAPSNSVTPASPTPHVGVGLYSAAQLQSKSDWSTAISQGWAGLLDEEALGTSSSPFTVPNLNADAGVQAALDANPSYTGFWMSFWTVSSPDPNTDSNPTDYYNAGHDAGVFAAHHEQGLGGTRMPDYMAIDFEGIHIPSNNAEYTAETNGWADGTYSAESDTPYCGQDHH